MCVCVCVCVCLSVKSHLTFGASVCPENTVMNSTDSGDGNIVGFPLKLLCFRATALPALYGYRATDLWNRDLGQTPIVGRTSFRSYITVS